MNGNIFSEKYIKEKLNRLEQINSQKRLKVQQATISKKPQMSRSDYEKYKKILFEQNKKQNQTIEEKFNDAIPTQDISNQKEQGTKSLQNKQGSENIKMNKSLERNKSPKAGEIVFKTSKRNCSKTPKNNLNHSEILQKSPSQVLSPKQLQANPFNQQQKLKQSKSLMKLSNTAKPAEMSESQLTQEIPNSSRTQNVLQNMKSILSIASPNAYFSNATSTMEDPNLLEQTQQQNNIHRFNQRQNFQNNQFQYTPQPISPSSHTMIPMMAQQNDNENIFVQGIYPTYQTQQSIEFINTNNPEFIQMVNNQNMAMKNSQFSNQNEDNYLNIYNKQQNNEYSYQQNPAFFQQKPIFQKNFQPQQQIQQNLNYDTFEQNNYAQASINFTSPRTNNFQKQNEEIQDRNYNQNGPSFNISSKRQYSQPNFDQSSLENQQYQLANQQQFPMYERKHSLTSYYENNNNNNINQSGIQMQQQYYNHQTRNSQVDFDKYFLEEQQYLQQLSHLGIQDDLNESEHFIHQLKHNQTLLKQEKEQLERELAELEVQTKHIKNSHVRQQSHSYNDQPSEQTRTVFLEASFKKQNPISEQNHFAHDNLQQQLRFEEKWEMIEREEEETEKSFMIISEYLNMQSDQTKRKTKSRQNSQFKEENTSKSNIITPSVVYGKKSDEFEKKPSRKSSDQIERSQQNIQKKGERDEEDMEWLDGIEESFCELKCINKNELMPYYTELQSKKKSYLDRYSPNSKSRLVDAAEEDAYTKLKNQIIGKTNISNSLKILDFKLGIKQNTDSQVKTNQRALSSAKLQNIVNEISSQEVHSKKEIFQESGTKGTKSPQFGASGKNPQLFSYLNEQNNKDNTELAFKDANFFKQKLTSPSSQSTIVNTYGQYSDRFEQPSAQLKQDLRRQPDNFSNSQIDQEQGFVKSSSCNNLIKNFYDDINQIQKKNSEKFLKQDQALYQTDRNIQKSNEILEKINQKYPNSHLNFSKSGNSKRMSQEYQMEQQQPQENMIDDEEYRQQQYIMRKLKEMEAENNSQTSSIRDKELQYSQTVSSYLAQGDSQFKRSQSPLYSNLNEEKEHKLLQNRQQESQSLHKLLQNRRNEQQQNKGDQINEELQVADLHNYSSFRNELQQSEQQHNEYYEDQYFKFSNNKNSSFEKELQQIQIDQNDINQLQQKSQSIQNQKKNLFQSLMKNVQQELGNKNSLARDSLLQQNKAEPTSKFQQKLDSRMESFYQQYEEGQKQDDKSLKSGQEKSNIQNQLNKVFKGNVQSDDDSNSSGDELEETILQKLQKLKKKRDSEQKEKSPLLQNSHIISEQKNRPLTASKRGSQDSSSSYEQVNKENTQNNLQMIKNNQLNESAGAKMKLDELFNKNKLKDSSSQLENNQQNSSSKQNSTREKISSIQQKLNNLFEKKNVQSPQQQQLENVEINSSNKYETDNYNQAQKQSKQIQQNNQEGEPRIDRKVIDSLAEEVEMLMKMQNLENQFKEKDNQNKQLKQEYFQHERHIYGEDIDALQHEESDQFGGEYNNQTDSQKNFFKTKQQLPLYEIEEEHSVDNSIVDQNFQMRNQYQ
ncbi:hypothetical protein TTHERM_00157950 (macronuclear) [Tetrahymena thermophila SB210]|uniref:Uncharacterized protein n=1 Tax=Tetrahymena thermophila (strain SB210) TaxID=312017 RepID=Q22WD9_TETTS|nr:hypothetical protein TTHERM_00157950 [Tetrahymena thermophila SB210]EAR89478.2 hypothetical protein TTHERM_00157950 [Tetrahymena thermophila SB210]|eukprot:XP_001009723.2 hypothetical protein TTHERM_00157950 [Tetrahymena thermophila SB210]